MTKNKKLLLSALLLTLFSWTFLYSQDQEETKPQKIELYGLGDQNFSINVGAIFPLFFFDPTPVDGGSSFAGTNLTVGGEGSLLYEVFLTSNFKVGLELGGMFAFSPNDNSFFMVPITARAAYEFHFGQFSLPFYLGLGVNILTYEEVTDVQFIMKPGVSLYWNYNSDWSFGGNLVYWIAPEIIPSNNEYDRIGNFLDFTISARYHF